MYEDYWGLQSAPFRRSGILPFFRAGSHVEALARLHYLAQAAMPLGIVVGSDGVGKSTVLQHFARQMTRTGYSARWLSLLGIGLDEFTTQLARLLGGMHVPHGGTVAHWTSILDRLAVHAFQSHGILLLLDDVDQAKPDVQIAVQRLVQWPGIAARSMSVVVAANGSRLGLVRQELKEKCDLRIDLDPWTVDETANYVRESLQAAGRKAPAFDIRAMETIHHLSGGAPRRIRQLAELALIAGAAEQLELIDTETVRDALQELQMARPEFEAA